MLNIIRGITTYIFFLAIFYSILYKLFNFFIKIENNYLSLFSLLLSLLIVFRIIKVNF